LTVLKNHLSSTVANKVVTAEEISSSDAEYEKWIRSESAAKNVSPAQMESDFCRITKMESD